MLRAGVVVVLGSASVFRGANTLRTKHQQDSVVADGAGESVQQATGTRDQEPDWGKAMAGALDWMKKQGGATPPSFDLGNVMKQVLQPQAPAAGAASKNPFDLGNIMKQALTPKAPADAPASSNLFDLGKRVDTTMQASADRAPSRSQFDLGNVMKQALTPQAPADAAASKNPFDLGNVMKQALAPKAQADGAATKNPVDLGDLMKQMLKPKASASPDMAQVASAQSTQPAASSTHAPNVSAPANTFNILDWVKRQQKKADTSTAEAANQAAKQTAHSSLGDFMKWAKDQAEKAAKAAGEQAAAKEVAKATVTKAEHEKEKETVELPSTRTVMDESMHEAKQEAEEALQHLTDTAKSAATKAAEEDAAKIVQKKTQAEEEATALSKATVDSSIAQAEEHIRAADSADGATRKAAEKAAQEASQQALKDLLEWVQAEDSEDQGQVAGDEGGAEKKAGFNPVHNAWVNALNAEKKARTADWLAGTVEDIAEQAEKAVMAGHNLSKGLFKGGLPGSTHVALGTAQDVVHKANITVSRSNLLAAIARYVRGLLRKSVLAAQQASNPEDFKKAWAAVSRAYGAAGKVQEDARKALTSSRDALGSVATSMAEVGWRSVSEVLRAEVKLLVEMVSKAATKGDGSSLGAWLNGIGHAGTVAQSAWLKGFSQGLQAMAQHDVTGKVQRASDSTAKASVAWTRALANIMGSKEARQAVGQAAGSATRAASAAAAAAASGTLDTFRQASKHLANPSPWFPTFKASGNWDPTDGYKGKLYGSYAGANFSAHIHAVPNATHERTVIGGDIHMPDKRVIQGQAVGVLGKSKKVGTFAKYFLRQKASHEPSAGTAVSFRSDPTGPNTEHVHSSSLSWTGRSYAMNGLDAHSGDDGRSMGTYTGEFKTPDLARPLKLKADYVQPAATNIR
mmetsp:Transcript_48891/g.141629  ORF Transcript_48891/g.141629 Transcript_48891/m.141629 type:complete len:914 (-) Transcript_48891:192-2933(-)